MRAAGVCAVAVIMGVALSGCTPGGNSMASSLAERVIIGIGDDITPAYPKPLEADYLAAWAIESPRLPDVAPPVDYEIDALDWSGNSGDEEGATITLRIGVHVQEYHPSTLFSPSYAEGRATRCWQLTVFGYHDYDSLEQTEITCPEGAEARVPDPAPLPTFPDDVDARLQQAITGATAIDIDERVAAAFPEEYYSIVSDTLDGEVAVALGIPSELECAVGVVHADASVEVIRGWQKVLLQPGETGCSPSLYFSPVTTH